MIEPLDLTPPTPIPDLEPVQNSRINRVSGLAISAAAGYALHTVFHSGTFELAHDSIGSPLAEVAEIAVISSALAFSGLREYVVGGRRRHTNNKFERALGKTTKDGHEVQFVKDSYGRIIEGKTELATDPDKLATDPDKLFVDSPDHRIIPAKEDKVRKRIGKGQVDERYVAPDVRFPRRHRKHLIALDKARDKIRELELARSIKAQLYGETTWVMDEELKKPRQVNDFGTPKHLERISNKPTRRKTQIEGEVEAINTYSQMGHKIQHLTKQAEHQTVGKEVERYYKHGRRRNKLSDKLAKQTTKQNKIRNREDLPSRVFDTTVRKTKSGARKITSSGQNWIGGIASAPRVYREAKDGRTGNGGRVQKRIDNVARKLGSRRSRRKASSS